MAQYRLKANRTSTLLHRLFKAPNLDEFLQNNISASEFPEFYIYISDLCKQTGQVPEQIIKRAMIDRTYGHQIFNGTRRPSRDKVILLAFGFGLNVDETQGLLRMAQKSTLYPRIMRDAVILRCLNDHTDVITTQSMLQTLGLTLLGGEDKHG